MFDQDSKIKELIKYLVRVFNGTELTQESLIEKEKFGEYGKEEEIIRSQDFFIMPKELDMVLKEWFVEFDNKEQLNKAIKFKLEQLKKLSFQKGKKDFFIVKTLSNHRNLTLSKETNNSYSYVIHSHLIKIFEEKLGSKKTTENKRITIKDKKVYDTIKLLDLKIDFLKDDCKPEEFIGILLGATKKDVYLNINNGSFHYIITKLSSFFYNLSMTSVTNTNRIYSSRGTLLNARNLNNSKSYNPKHKDTIDEVFKKFQ